MADLLSKPDELCGFLRAESWGGQCNPPLLAVINPGELRIGGDPPNGLVLVGISPASREVRLFDRETSVLVAITTSSGSGTYSFDNLSTRTEGYDVVIRGDINAGERDVIIPGVHPI